MLRDLRLSIRTLARTPAFALTTIGVLALGIGANTAIFGLVNQVLLRPPGIADPGRVVAIRARYEKLNLSSISVSAPDFRDVQRATSVFQSAAIVRQRDYNYLAGDVPERLQGAEVSAQWFDVFGATPYLGRTFRAEEDQPGANTSVVLAYATWLRVFGGEPSIVGRTIDLNQKPYKVVGVMKGDFRWPRRVDVWVPIGLPAAQFTDDYRFNEAYGGVARTRPGVSFEQAQALVRLTADRVRNSRGDDGRFARDSRWGMFLLPMTDFAAGDTKTPLLVLMGAVGFVLLIACANVAGLMVARTTGRGREIAVRCALGATRLQLLRQTMAESAALAFGGATLGLALAWGATRLLLLVAPEDATLGLSPRIDVPVLLFTLLAAIAAALLAAGAPAWQAARIAPVEGLKTGGRSATPGRPRQHLRSVLVVSQAALALVLLIGAGLLLRSLGRLEQVTPGFEPRDVVTAMLSLPESRYKTADRQIAFYRSVTEQLAGAPGVTAVAAGVPVPFSGASSSASFAIEGRSLGPGDPGPHGDVRLVTPRYFAALGIPLRMGRVFTDQDGATTAPVVVIDENLARQYWPGENPIGRRMRNGGPRDPWATIIGVVGHVRHSDLAADTGKGTYYYSIFQQPARFAAIVVKTSSEGRTAVAAIRDAVRRVDPSQPLHTIRRMDDMIWASLAPRRFAMRLLGFFAGVALFMAALGLYAVVSYSVTQRTTEIGVRMALGAARGQVLRLVVVQGMKLAAIGVAGGVVASLASSRLLTSQLYGVQPFDPPTLAAMIAALLGAAFLASYVPARRATRVDPLVALRAE